MKNITLSKKPDTKEYILYDYMYMKFKARLIYGNIGSYLGAWCIFEGKWL